jgi:hypothetical protein
MMAFGSYVAQLHELLVKAAGAPRNAIYKAAIEAALDGQPSAELRRQVSLSQLRSTGAFFTGSTIARRAAAIGFPRDCSDAIVADPACGAGDLLVAIAERLPRLPDLQATLWDWSSRIVGRDLEADFVRATKLRLVLKAILLLGPKTPVQLPDLDKLFPKITAGCSLNDEEVFRFSSHVIINPPFTSVVAPDDCTWASGKVNAAAVFMDACVTRCCPGTRVIAILPDVLRSGSRYEKWRRLFERRFRLTKVEIIGQFDHQTDVDVFIAVGFVRRSTRKNCGSIWIPLERTWGRRIQDIFDISVGPVVPYRDPHRGPWHPFIQARKLPCWQAVSSITVHRRFQGRTFDPPFVVIRRTSRPGDKHRAIPTLIIGDRTVAVENHLIVLQPKDKALATCRGLFSLLAQPCVTEWMDRRIRCRHLTVTSVAELPWGGANDK